MTIALRSLLIGVCLATAMHLWLSPPLGMVLVAFVAGQCLGIATAWYSDGVEWFAGRFD